MGEGLSTRDPPQSGGMVAPTSHDTVEGDSGRSKRAFQYSECFGFRQSLNLESRIYITSLPEKKILITSMCTKLQLIAVADTQPF